MRPPAAVQRIHRSPDIACVAAAVAAREVALGQGIEAHGDALVAAHSARGSALAGAYTASTTPAIRQGVRSSWAAFTTAVRSARKNWHTVRDAAWATFRTAAKACKPSADVLDSANASSETTGD